MSSSSSCSTTVVGGFFGNKTGHQDNDDGQQGQEPKDKKVQEQQLPVERIEQLTAIFKKRKIDYEANIAKWDNSGKDLIKRVGETFAKFQQEIEIMMGSMNQCQEQKWRYITLRNANDFEMKQAIARETEVYITELKKANRKKKATIIKPEKKP